MTETPPTTNEPSRTRAITLAAGLFLAGLALGAALTWGFPTDSGGTLSLAALLMAAGTLTALLVATFRWRQVAVLPSAAAPIDEDTAAVLNKFKEVGGGLSQAKTKNSAWVAERLGLVLDSTAEGVIGLDADGHVVLANEAAAHLLGAGEPMALLGLAITKVSPPLPDGVDSPLVEAVMNARSATATDDTLYRRDATPFRARWSIRHLHSQDELKCVLTFDDITDVVEREARTRTAQKLEMVGQLAGVMAHDFNNVLQSILISIELLQMESPPNTLGRSRHRAIRDLIRRGKNLVANITAFAHLEEDAPLVSIDLVSAVEEMEPMLHRLSGDAITVHLNLSPEPAWAVLPRGGLQHILANLTLNAKDAMADGGQLRIDVGNKGGRPYLRVIDDGRGMTPEVLERAMQPYFSTKDEGKAAGLGLPTVYNLVRRTGGEMEIASKDRDGTRVTVTLIAAEEQPEDQLETSELEAGRAKGTVLVVEDLEELRSAVFEALDHMGYTVLVAEDPPAALKITETATAIDLLFTDIVMPNGNGYDLAREFLHRKPQARVLFTSGHAQPAEHRKGELGVWPMLPKPYHLSQLRQAVHDLMN